MCDQIHTFEKLAVKYFKHSIHHTFHVFDGSHPSAAMEMQLFTLVGQRLQLSTIDTM